jgi:hypothetical protein
MCTQPWTAFFIFRSGLIVTRLARVYCIDIFFKSRYSDWTTGVRFPTGARDCRLLHSAQSVSEVHPASYVMGVGTPSLGVKRPEREAVHLPPPPYVLILLKQHWIPGKVCSSSLCHFPHMTVNQYVPYESRCFVRFFPLTRRGSFL